MGRLVFVPLPLFLYRFLLGSLVFGFVGLFAYFSIRCGWFLTFIIPVMKRNQV